MNSFSSRRERGYIFFKPVLMGRAIPDVIKEAARGLRKNSTDSEKMLWDKLRNKKIGYRFVRQAPIYFYTENSGLDRYIISDFYCPEKRLIIELDGSIHDVEEIYQLDIVKEELLIQAGYRILRFKNDKIHNNLAQVIGMIRKY